VGLARADLDDGRAYGGIGKQGLRLHGLCHGADHGCAFSGAVIGGIIVGVVTTLAFFITELDSNTSFFFNLLLNVAIFGALGAVAGGVIGFFVGLVQGAKNRSDEKKRLDLEYKIAYETYQKRIRDDKIRVANELKQKELLFQQKAKLLQKMQQSKLLLKELYDRMNLNEKFRNLIPIGYMHEFLNLGISTKLEGVDGLYYLIKQELRQDQMSCTLERIVEQLDTIIENQNEIKQDLKNIDRKCDRMLDETIKMSAEVSKSKEYAKQTMENTATSAYYNERMDKELRYQSFIMTFFN